MSHHVHPSGVAPFNTQRWIANSEITFDAIWFAGYTHSRSVAVPGVYVRVETSRMICYHLLRLAPDGIRNESRYEPHKHS